MANLIHKQTLQYLKSVHTPDYNLDDYIKLNNIAEVEAVEAIPQKYWKLNGPQTAIIEMSQGEKDTVDQALSDAAAQATEDAKDITLTFNKLTKAFALVVLDEINALRSNASLSERTQNQLVTAVKSKYDTL